MLLQNYSVEIFRPDCNANFQSLHCHVHLEDDIGEVIPYLNGHLGGFSFTASPPAVMFKIHGRLIAVHSDKISINALQDKEEAFRIIDWLVREINSTWQNRHEIQPEFSSVKKPLIIEILKHLPQTNCQDCGQPTCLVFASLVVEGAKAVGDCCHLHSDDLEILTHYLEKFSLSP